MFFFCKVLYDVSQNVRNGSVKYNLNSVNEFLKASTHTFCDAELIEQLWIQVRLEGADKLLIGCLYRSPSDNGHQSVNNLVKLLCVVCDTNPSHLLLAGDFNLPEIDWQNSFSTAPDNHYTHTFIDAINGCFLHQHVNTTC